MKKKSNVFTIACGASAAVFLGLMVYAMNKDPNVLPSQLVDKPAQTFVAPVAQGGSFDLQQHVAKGQWVILNFWSTTCIVCREEAPELERFYQDVSSKGAPYPKFVSINIQESNQDILEYARAYSLTYPIVSDRTGKISLDYGVTGTPETFFIDPSGKVRHRVAGEVSKDSMLRFVDWLEKNPKITPEEALRGFSQARLGSG